MNLVLGQHSLPINHIHDRSEGDCYQFRSHNDRLPIYIPFVYVIIQFYSINPSVNIYFQLTVYLNLSTYTIFSELSRFYLYRFELRLHSLFNDINNCIHLNHNNLCTFVLYYLFKLKFRNACMFPVFEAKKKSLNYEKHII